MPQDRFAIDCRDVPGSRCSLRITGTREEVEAAAVHHAVTAHGHPNTNETREKLRGMIKQDVREPA